MNLTTQVREIAKVITAVALGDLTKIIGVEVQGEIASLKDIINTMVNRLGIFALEVRKVAREVGTDGTLGGQAEVDNVEGKWKELTENESNMMKRSDIEPRPFPLYTSVYYHLITFQRKTNSSSSTSLFSRAVIASPCITPNQ